MTRIPQRAFAGGIVSPGFYPRKDIPKHNQALKDAANITLRAEGGALSRAGFEAVTGWDNSTVDGYQWMIPFEASEDDTYILEFGEQVMRVIKNGGYVLNSTIGGQEVTDVAEGTSPASEFTMVNSTAASQFTVGRLVFFSDPNGDCVFGGQVFKVTAIASDKVEFTIFGDDNVTGTGSEFGTVGSGAELYEVYEITSPYAIEDMSLVQTVQDVDTLFLAHDGYDPRQLQRVADDDWTFSVPTVAPEIDAPTSIAAAATNGSGSTSYVYTVAAVDGETGEESLPGTEDSTTNDLTTAGNYNTVTWAAVTGASYYRVYKEFNGIMGFIGLTEDLTFDDENITPDTADNPQTARDPFSGTNDKPAVTSFVDQRLVFAATVNNNQSVEMSSSVAPLNFNRALTPGASDAISFRMRAQKLNRVCHIVDAEKPVILTTGAEWYVDTGDDAGMAPGNFTLRPKTYRGSARRPSPLIIGENLLHVTRDKNTLREFSLAYGRDAASADLTLLARHLFRGKTITSMAYAQSPDSVVWVTLETGELYSMTYLSAHEIWGWTRHEVGGDDAVVRQVAVVTEGAYDTPYFVVSRTLQGETRTTIERLNTREFTQVEDCYFVDGGLQITGPVTTIRGLLHLRGQTVTALSDGNVIEELTVSDLGTVELPAEADTVAVGLGYDAYMILLDSDLGDQIRELGSSLGRFISIDEVALKVVDTRGIAVGIEGGTLNEIKQFTGEAPIPLFTGTLVQVIDGDWERDQAVEVRQTYPLPMTITAVAPSYTMGE